MLARWLPRWAWERVGRGIYCYVAVCSAALGASEPTGGEEGRGHIVAAARLQLVISWQNATELENHAVRR